MSTLLIEKRGKSHPFSKHQYVICIDYPYAHQLDKQTLNCHLESIIPLVRSDIDIAYKGNNSGKHNEAFSFDVYRYLASEPEGDKIFICISSSKVKNLIPNWLTVKESNAIRNIHTVPDNCFYFTRLGDFEELPTPMNFSSYDDNFVEKKIVWGFLLDDSLTYLDSQKTFQSVELPPNRLFTPTLIKPKAVESVEASLLYNRCTEPLECPCCDLIIDYYGFQ